jgi:hypothetical protein
MINGIYWTLYLLKFKAVNYTFNLIKPSSGCTYSLMPYSANSIVPSKIKRLPDSGYIVVLPKIEIYNEAQEKVREIGAYCMPISLVNPIQPSLAGATGHERSSLSNVNRSNGQADDAPTAQQRRQPRYDELKTANKYGDHRSLLKARTETQPSRGEPSRTYYQNGQKYNYREEQETESEKYSPKAFKHLRSMEQYVTPEVMTPPRQAQDPNPRGRDPRSEHQFKPKSDEFSFDIYSHKVGGLSPLDHIERHLLLNNSGTGTSSLHPSEQRDVMGDLKLDKNNIRWYRDDQEYRRAEARKESAYTPPFRDNVILKKISESPLTSPHNTNVDRKRSSEQKPVEPYRHHRESHGATRDTYTRTKPHQHERPARFLTFDEPQPSIESYPGSLLNLSESKN